jgi:sortase A
MKRSRDSSETLDLVERVKALFARNRPSPDEEAPSSERPRSRRLQLLAAGAVITVPALVASFVAGTGSEPPPAKVTQVLESIGDPPRDRSKAPRGRSDAPVARSVASKTVGITFERGDRVPIGYIKIPAVDLETKFFDGVTDGAVKRGPGHWPGTPWPGESGNTVFAGHRTTYTRPFADLDLLKEGQRVVAQVRNGPRTTYRVFRTTVVPEAEYADFVLQQPQDKHARMITLFACTPKGFRTHRIVVQAKATPVADQSKSKASHKEEGAMADS